MKTKVRDTNTHKHTQTNKHTQTHTHKHTHTNTHTQTNCTKVCMIHSLKRLHCSFLPQVMCVCVGVCVCVCVFVFVCHKTSMFAFHKVSFCVIEFSLFTLCPLFHNLSLCSIRYPSISISPHSSYFLSFRQLQDNLNRLFDFFDIVFHSTKAFCSIQNVKK